MYEGSICKVIEDRGFGFIATPGQKDVFYHAKDLLDLEFGPSILEQRVKFDVVDSDRGPRARNVQAAT